MNKTKANIYMLNEERVKEVVRTAIKDGSALDLLNDSRYAVFPGFCDVHVHFREPGFSYKETMASGTGAAAAGGFTSVCTMPNLNPVPDNLAHLKEQLDIIEKDAVIDVMPYGAITVGEKGEKIADLEAMAPYVVAFSDDGRGIQDKEVMREAMQRVKALGKVLVAHCEVESLLKDGYIHEGEYARKHAHRGICSESEWREVERDIKLADETACAFHACHISCKESVQLIRDAKKSGVDVSCETAPHYLLLSDSDLQESGRFKMNPPLRSKNDRDALIEGILDGTIDMIATDHAPHSKEEKNKGLKDSFFGIVGIETAFPTLYTKLVLGGVLSPEKLIRLMTINPRKRLKMKEPEKDLTIFDLESEYIIDSAKFLSKGKATPFDGMRVKGECILTIADGKAVYSK